MVHINIPATPSTLCLSPTTTPSPINSAPPTISTIVPWRANINQTAIFELLAHLKQGLGDIKEGLNKMKKSVEQCFDQVNSMLADMKGAYDTTSLQQLFQVSPKVQSLLPQDLMFSVEGSQGSHLNALFTQSVLDGLMWQYIRYTPLQQSQPLASKW